MSPRPLPRLVEGLPGARAGHRLPSVPITAVTADSREVTPGTLMVCIAGEHHDGHDHAAEAVGRGAVALVVERPLDPPLEPPVPMLEVDDARLALALLADRMHDHPSGRLDLVGVTGTDGKSTTVHLGASIARAAGEIPATIGTLGIRIGDEVTSGTHTTPDAAAFHGALSTMAAAGARAVWAEISSHGLTQHRSAGAEYRVCALTNFTRDHLDYHTTREAYRDAKGRLFDRSAWHVDPAAETGRQPVAILPGDDPEAAWFVEHTRLPVEVYGFGDGVDWSLSSVTLAPRHSRGVLTGPTDRIAIEIPMPGRFNLRNAAIAAIAGLHLGLHPGAIREGLATAPPMPGRMEVIDAGQPFTVLVDFAHTPDALATVLETVRELVRGRILCVVGCGGNRDRGKRPEMGRVAVAGADVAIFTSDNPRFEDPEAILDEIEAGARLAGGTWVRRSIRAEAIAEAITAAREGDVVVVAGKGHEGVQIIGNQQRPSDDRALCRRALLVAGWADAPGEGR